VAFDGLSIILGWLVKRSADTALQAALKQTLARRLQASADAWRKSLPRELKGHELWPEALLNLADSDINPNSARTALRAALAERVPTEQEWFDALMERWRELHAQDGGAEFFAQDEECAGSHLRGLARGMQRCCAQEPALVLPTLIAAAAASQVISAEGGFHPEIDRAKQALDGESPDVGSDILDTLRQRHWDKMSARERYRVQTLRGHSRLARGQSADAGALFLEAAQLQPEDEQAKAYGALGRFLVGDRAEAFKLSTEVLLRTPNGTAATVFIASAPPEMTLDEVEAAIPPALRDHVDVARYLSQRARIEGEFSRAETHARAALKAKPELVESQIELACVLLQRVATVAADRPTAFAPEIREELTEAHALFTRALVRARHGPIAAQVRLDRSMCSELLGDSKSAEMDVREAHAVASDYLPAAIRLSDILRVNGDLSGALDALARVHAQPVAAIARAQLLRQQGTRESLRMARVVLEKIAKQVESAEPFVRAQYMFELVGVCCAAHEWDAAEASARSEGGLSVPAALRFALSANIAGSRGDRAGAKALAAQAVDALTEGDEPEVRRLVAHVLEQAGLPAAAMAPWRSVIDVRMPTRDAHRFVGCALKSGNDFAALEFCREVRAAGARDDYLLEAQVSICERYNAFDEAIDITVEQMNLETDKDRAAEFGVTAAYYALRKGDLALAKQYVSVLPAPVGADPHRARAAIQILRATGQADAAAAYAYEVARVHPDDREARLGLFEAMGFGGGPEGTAAQFETVEVGCAVRVRFEDEPEDAWYVILDRPDVQPGRREFKPSHPHVAAMLGRGVGERFTVQRPVQSRTGTIAEILPKETWLLRSSLETWDVAFPEDVSILKFKLPAEGPPKEKLAPMLQMLDEKQRVGTTALELYRAKLAPAHAIGQILGVHSAFEAFLGLAEDPSVAKKCCGNEEVLPGIERAGCAREVALDPSAIATLFLLDGSSLLDAPGIRFIVGEGALQELRQSALLDESDRKAGTFGKIGDQYVYRETDPAAAANARTRLRGLISKLESKCERLSGVALAKLPSALRTMLTQLLGVAGAEALAIAAERRCPVWSDDQAVALIAHSDLGVGRVTTQWVALALLGKGQVDANAVARLSLGLLRHDYKVTAVNAAALAEAVAEAKGDVAATPLDDVLKYMESPGVGGVALANAIVRALVSAREKGIERSRFDALAARFASIVMRNPQGAELRSYIVDELERFSAGKVELGEALAAFKNAT
jgi:transcription elongation GreA/GreB family factor